MYAINVYLLYCSWHHFGFRKDFNRWCYHFNVLNILVTKKKKEMLGEHVLLGRFRILKKFLHSGVSYVLYMRNANFVSRYRLERWNFEQSPFSKNLGPNSLISNVSWKLSKWWPKKFISGKILIPLKDIQKHCIFWVNSCYCFLFCNNCCYF